MKAITSSFFTTINFKMFLKALSSISIIIIKLKSGKEELKIKKELLKYLFGKKYNSKDIISFYNWRSALYHGIKILDIWDWDEVILQAYTCVSVVNSIVQTWAKPIFIDINEDDLNINSNLIEEKITSKTKAIIAQHTFWNPANIEEIQKICKKNNLYFIEDCAHSLWARYKWEKVWTFWDIAIFSFGRDKVISSVNWGFLVFEKNEKNEEKKDEIKENMHYPEISEIIKNHIYIITAYIASKLYWFWKVWKIIFWVNLKYKLMPEVLTKKEKELKYTYFNYKYPNSLAYIALSELKKVEDYNNHRIDIANIYDENLIKIRKIKQEDENKNIFLRYSIFLKEKDQIIKNLRKKWIYLWDWYDSPVAPKNVELEKIWYIAWSCPVAEKLSKQTINLANHFWINKKDVYRIIKEIKKIINK